MVVVVNGPPIVAVATATAILSMLWWNSGTDVRKAGLLLLVEGSSTSAGIFSSGTVGSSRGGFLGTIAPSNVGLAVAVTAMAGVALAATIVYSRRGSLTLKSPWSRRRRKIALSPQQWKNLFTPEGKLHDGVKFLKKVRSGGVDPSIRAEVWPFLLGVYKLDSTHEERESIRAAKREEYEKMRRTCKQLLKQSDESVKLTEPNRTDSNKGKESVNRGLKSPGSDVSDKESICIDPGSPECEKRGHQIEDRSHHTVEEDEGQSGITNSDVSPAVTESSDSDSVEESHTIQTFTVYGESEESDATKPAKEDSTASKAEHKSISRTTEDYVTWQRIIRLDAVRANADWVVHSPAQAAVCESKALHFAEVVGLKDHDHLAPYRIYHAGRLVAILEAYALYDPEIGYCQGMSDLLSPIVAIIEEDYMAFWCFVGFMRKARHNFRLDEVGIRRQLNIVSKIIKCKDSHLFRHLEALQAEDCFFVYRMVVVLFRRELTFEQTMCLWEVMWADQAAIRARIGKSAWGRIRLKAPPTDDLLLYAIAACVLQRRKLIIEKYSGMDEIIRECNSMAGHLDVWRLLDDAHDLVVTLHDKI